MRAKPLAGATHLNQTSRLPPQNSEVFGQSSSVGWLGLVVAVSVLNGTGTFASTTVAVVHSSFPCAVMAVRPMEPAESTADARTPAHGVSPIFFSCFMSMHL